MTPSVGNFLLLRFPGDDGRTAADADRFLSARGFVLRGVGGLRPARLPAHDGRDAKRPTEGVVAALAEFMKGGRHDG